MSEKELGEAFNLKDFHDVILESFGPLHVMEEEVQKWIANVKENTTRAKLSH